MTPGDIPEAAASGFGAGAGAYAYAYAKGRPTYPPEAVEHIARRCAVGPGRTVVDLGAGTGTGIFTSLLLDTGASVIAVEPVSAMRDRIPAAATVLGGTAEAIPLDDEQVDAVVVAQAFHWFRHDEALAEIARVLRPGGHLALVWNRRDESVDHMSQVIQWRANQVSEYDRTDWPAVVGRSGRFGPVDHETFSWAHVVDRATLAERVRSVSYVAAMDGDRREALVDEVMALVEGFPDTFPLPYDTLAWCTTRS